MSETLLSGGLYEITQLLAKINRLEQEIKEKDLIVKSLEQQVEFYSERSLSLERRVSELERLIYSGERHEFTSSGTDINHSLRNQMTELLLIVSDRTIQMDDEIALNKARIPYRRIISATQQKILEELRRRRRERAMYRYVMFSAHSTPEGIYMADGTKLDTYWMNANLSGVDILYLNGCSTVKIGDDLIGVANHVISITEDVESKIAASFAEVFWYEVQNGAEPADAFVTALTVEPSMRPYVDFRSID